MDNRLRNLSDIARECIVNSLTTLATRQFNKRSQFGLLERCLRHIGHIVCDDI